MKKQEALEYIRKHKGYVPYITLFEIYDDDDEIPEELVNLEIRKESFAPGGFMICGAELKKQLDKIL